MARAVVLASLAIWAQISFAAEAGVASAAPKVLTKAGVVLTFDDRNFSDWLKAMPLFAKYDARATFFISGPIDAPALDAAKRLQSFGHAIGAHGVKHLEAVTFAQKHPTADYVRQEVLPQIEALKAAGIIVTSFGYPRSQNDTNTDAALLKTVRHLRTGSSLKDGKRVCDHDAFFVAVSKIREHGCLVAKGIDYAPTKPDRTFEQIDGALARAAQRQEILALYAHDIAATAKSHHLTPEALEHVLKKIKELGLEFYTFDDLP